MAKYKYIEMEKINKDIFIYRCILGWVMTLVLIVYAIGCLIPILNAYVMEKLDTLKLPDSIYAKRYSEVKEAKY